MAQETSTNIDIFCLLKSAPQEQEPLHFNGAGPDSDVQMFGNGDYWNRFLYLQLALTPNQII
jgi:hypothetical protein